VGIMTLTTTAIFSALYGVYKYAKGYPTDACFFGIVAVFLNGLYFDV
jgi:phosphatidylserine synthase